MRRSDPTANSSGADDPVTTDEGNRQAPSGGEHRPRRIRLSRQRGWRLPANSVTVARPTPWGNPFLKGRDGAAADCVERYRRLMQGEIATNVQASPDEQRRVLDHVRENIHSLRGRNLACWCPLDGPCHADILLDLANGKRG